MTKNLIPIIAAILLLMLLLPDISGAQLPRERVTPDRPVEYTFWASKNIGISTVHQLPARNLNTTVLHTFGLVHGGEHYRGIDRFFGLDDGANTRIGLEYGITDRLSAGIGRMTFNNIVDVSGKYHVMRQTRTDSRPLDLAVKMSIGINTMPGLGLDFDERLSYFVSLMIARKFDHFSLQLTPMVTHFNHTVGDNEDQLFGLGILAKRELSDRFALSAEYLPVIGDRNTGTNDAMAVALNIDTGGHVFQVFLTSSQWHNEQFIMANNRDRFWRGDFRFGFNIHRSFRL